MSKLLAPLLFIAFLPIDSHAEQAAPLPLEARKTEAVYGFPNSRKQDTTKICRKAYAVEYDNKAKIPVWESYVLTPIRATGCYARSNAFSPDYSLPVEYRATPKDYAKSGYDIGHMVNDGDMRWDMEAEDQSFILTNMAPQLPAFNRGIWKKLEDSSRGWSVNRRHALQIYVGPIYDRAQNPTIGKNMVTIPHAFFKVIIDVETHEVMAFVFKHEGSKKDLSSFITSLAEVQRQTGLVLPMPVNPIFADKTWPRIMKTASRAKATICSLQP